MTKYFFTLLLAVSPLCSFATARPDVDELLTVMRAEKTMQTTIEQVKKMIPAMTANIIGKMSNFPPDAAEKAKANQERIFSFVEVEMSWQKIKGDFAQIYAEALTPEEIKGIIAFYKSPAGQAFLDKQPVIQQKAMLMQQKMMMSMMPKIQALIKSEMGPAAKPGQ